MKPIHLKCGTDITLSDMEHAGISFVPCGQIEGEDRPLLAYKHLWNTRKQVTLESYGKKANLWNLRNMTGVQVMTGEPTYKPLKSSPNGYAYLTDLDIEARLVSEHPAICERIIDTYRSACVGTPCIVKTKSDGRRLSAFVPYLDAKRAFTDKDDEMLLEMFSRKGLSRLDHRYGMIEGSILEVPALLKETLQEIHSIISEISTERQASNRDRTVVEESQIGNLDIEWDQDGKSQYFPASHCQATSHKNSERLTVIFQKMRGGVQGHCFNCGDSWWETPPKSGTLPKRSPTLEITDDFSETLVSVEENEQAILNAFSTAITEDIEDEKPHYYILQFEMGSGKNHACLTRLAALKKRGIGIFENHEQSDAQVQSAVSEFGLRAMAFKGRGYKFEESGLSVIPVEMRSESTDLFSEYPLLMCGFYDQIQNWERKGLGAYEYCLQCPFLENCPYFAQFQPASQVDFLGVCVHDLFFDPGLAHFLSRIYRSGEDTEEEMIISEALGINTNPSKEFDLGILDEVVASNLYLSYHYKFQDFIELAAAWKGQVFGGFMTEVLKILQSREESDPLESILEYLKTLDEDEQHLINEQMTQIPVELDVEHHTQRDKETNEVLSEFYAIGAGRKAWRFPGSAETEKILRKKKVPTFSYKLSPHGKIGASPYHHLRSNNITLDDIQGRLWSQGWTLLDQLLKTVRLDIKWIGTKYNVEGQEICCDEMVITIPPQVNPMLQRLVLMGGTLDDDNIQEAFSGQDVKFTVSKGKSAKYAHGVNTFQFTDARVTYQSVFEVEKDVNGKKVYHEDSNSPKIVGVTAQSLKDIEQICSLAELHIADGNLKPVFISYKDFTEPPIADTDIGKRMHQCLQVKHFDVTRGLNFEGVKVFIVYGYPKTAHPDVIKATAEILHHADTEALDFTYERTDESAEGYKAKNIGKYRDPRVEAVRHQLTRDKSKQALFRSRPTRWENTMTMHFSAEPIPGFTERATGMIRPDLYRAESFEDIAKTIEERKSLTAESTIADFQRIYGCSERHARRLWEAAGGNKKVDDDNELARRVRELKKVKHSIRQIATELGISRGKVERLLKLS